MWLQFATDKRILVLLVYEKNYWNVGVMHLQGELFRDQMIAITQITQLGGQSG